MERTLVHIRGNTVPIANVIRPCRYTSLWLRAFPRYT